MNQLQQLERKARLWHIEQAAQRLSADDDRKEVLVSAIERQCIIIGEALNRALAEVRALLGSPPA